MALSPTDANSLTNLLAMRNNILQQNSALQKAATSSNPVEAGSSPAVGKSDFTDSFKNAITKVNDVQSQASEMTTAYERGETTDIAAVMLARQKASISFEATLQVRNKLLGAYRDIMNMPV